MEEPQKGHEPIITPVQRTRWIVYLVTLLIILGIAGFTYWYFVGSYYESTDDAYVNGNLVQSMSQISGQVTEIFADETDMVKEGEPLVALDKADVEIALKSAESQLAITVRQVSQQYSNIKQLQANVELQQASLQKAQEDYQRRQGLTANKTISAEDLQHAKLGVDSAKAALESAQKQLEAALALVGNTDLYHHPEVQKASVNLRNAYLNWERTIIYAPETGYIAKRLVQIGQQITPNTVLMIIVPLDQLWVDANFKETQLKHIRLGQPAVLWADFYGGEQKFHGKVVGLSPGTGSAFELLPPQNATGNWIKIVQRLPIRISLDPQELKQHPLRVGLSVYVEVDTHNRHGKVLTPVTGNKVVHSTKNFSNVSEQADKLIQQILETNSKNLPSPVQP